MNNQEIFDRVAVHLLTQRKQSLNSEGNCVYRSPEGLKCAIGCLIPDDKYKPSMEYKFVDSVEIMDACGFNYGAFLSGLQRIHDEYDVFQWQGELREFAKQRDLSTAVIDNKENNHG